MESSGMTEEEARDLMTKAGIPSENIDSDSINLTRGICDAVAQKFAATLVERVVQIVADDLKANGKIRKAVLYV